MYLPAGVADAAALYTRALAIRETTLGAWHVSVAATLTQLALQLELQRRYRFRPGRVFLMAEGTDSATQRERQGWLSGLCVEHGFRMSDRLHIHLYGDTRGT